MPSNFTDDGGNIYLRTRIAAQEGQNQAVEKYVRRELEISVADTGIGIRQEDIEKIFEPFSQLESPLSRKYPGTGLGLSLTRNLVEMHGGRIWVESAGLGKGATFRFTIPMQRSLG